jgi:hypothetical protein
VGRADPALTGGAVVVGETHAGGKRAALVRAAQWRGSTATLLAFSLAKPQHFSIYYDSLIEKCSTLPVVRAQRGRWGAFSSKLSVRME